LTGSDKVQIAEVGSSEELILNDNSQSEASNYDFEGASTLVVC